MEIASCSNKSNTSSSEKDMQASQREVLTSSNQSNTSSRVEYMQASQRETVSSSINQSNISSIVKGTHIPMLCCTFVCHIYVT